MDLHPRTNPVLSRSQPSRVDPREHWPMTLGNSGDGLKKVRWPTATLDVTVGENQCHVPTTAVHTHRAERRVVARASDGRERHMEITTSINISLGAGSCAGFVLVCPGPTGLHRR